MENKHTLEELEQLVIEWAKQRGLLDNPSYARWTAQFGKTIEELAELEQAINDNDLDAIKDAIGDICVTLIVRQAMTSTSRIFIPTFYARIKAHLYSKRLYMNNLRAAIVGVMLQPNRHSEAVGELFWVADILAKTDLQECLNIAYEQIKDRTGRMINNQFVKDK